MLGPYGETLVVDWGLAKVIGKPDLLAAQRDGACESSLAEATILPAGATVPGVAIGTPSYMSPEQARGAIEEIGPTSDVYSLGATLYELLTGQLAFPAGDNIVKTIEKVVKGRFPAPRSVQRSLPPALDAICSKAMALDPKERYQSVRALADDIEHWLADEPVTAYPEGTFGRVARWLRQHRSWTYSGAAGLVGVCVVATAALVVVDGLRRSEAEARHEAETNFDMAFNAVEEYLTNVSENTLLKEQDSVDIRNLRQQLLQNALKYYQQFVKQRALDPRLQKELAKAYFRVGLITQEIGSPHEALVALGSARAIWERLLAAEPQNEELKGQVGACYLTIGKLQQGKLDNFEEALNLLIRARTILEPLGSRHPDQATYQANLADCLSEIGIVEAHQELTDQALEKLKRARTKLEELINRSPEVIGYKSSLAGVMNNEGFVHYKKADYAAAIKSYEEMRDFCQGLLKDITIGPKPVWLLNRLAKADYNIATMQLARKDLPGALQSFERSLSSRKALADAHPSVTDYHENLGASYREIGDHLRGAHQDDKALDYLQKSLAIFQRLVQSDASAQLHSELARSWNALGVLYDEAKRDNAQAIGPFEQAVDQQERAAGMSEDVSDYKVNLSVYLENLGEQYLDLGEVERGRPYYVKAIEFRRGLHRGHPESKAYSLALAEALRKLGAIQRRAGDARAALKSFSDSAEILDALGASAPADAGVVYQRTVVLVQEAVATAEVQKPEDALPFLKRAVEMLRPLVTRESDSEARGSLSEALWHLARIHWVLNQQADAANFDLQRKELWKGRPAVELADLALKELDPATLIGYGKTEVSGRAKAVREQDLDLAASHLRLAFDNGFADVKRLTDNRDFGILKAHDDVASLVGRLGSPERHIEPERRNK
jgi:serine/threonine-protein kinase